MNLEQKLISGYPSDVTQTVESFLKEGWILVSMVQSSSASYTTLTVLLEKYV